MSDFIFTYLIQDIIIAFVTVFACALFIIGIIAYRRTRINKLLLVTVAFGLFTIKGIIMSIGLYQGYFDIKGKFVLMLDTILIFDFIILIILYLTVFRRG